MAKIDLIEIDPYLKPYEKHIEQRIKKIRQVEKSITNNQSLKKFASSHKYFGLHKFDDHWIFREFAPNAKEIYLIGDMTNWQIDGKFRLEKKENGVWEIFIPEDKISHGDLYKLYVKWDGGEGERIPSHATYVVQDENTKIFSAKVWCPENKYQ